MRTEENDKGAMRSNLSVFIAISLCVLCCTNCSRRKHISTREISPGLYREKVLTYSGGVFAGDSYRVYITDSVNFRVYVGAEEHDDEIIRIGITDNSWISVVKLSWYNDKDTIEQKNLSVQALIKEGKWD